MLGEKNISKIKCKVSTSLTRFLCAKTTGIIDYNRNVRRHGEQTRLDHILNDNLGAVGGVAMFFSQLIVVNLTEESKTTKQSTPGNP